MKTKILLVILLAAIIASVYLTYQRAIVHQNFQTVDSSAGSGS